MFDISKNIKEARTLPTSFYLDSNIFESSKTKIFNEAWHFIAPDQKLMKHRQIPISILPDFLKEEAVLINEKDGQIKLLSNVCTHRGNILVNKANDQPIIACGYHGRCFALDGKFKSMPAFDGVVDFPNHSDHLREYFIKNIGPLLLGNISKDNSNLIEEKWYSTLNVIKSRMPQFKFDALMHVPSLSNNYQLDAHWALYVDNYLEGFHVPFVHPSLGAALQLEDYAYEVFDQCNLQLGIAKEGRLKFELDQNHPDAGKGVYAYYWWIFPNIMLNCYPWGLSFNIIEPVGLEKTNIRYETYVFDLEDLSHQEETKIDDTEMEDEDIVMRVQQGIKSGSYNRGRYSPIHERCVHHFHRLVSGSMG